MKNHGNFKSFEETKLSDSRNILGQSQIKLETAKKERKWLLPKTVDKQLIKTSINLGIVRNLPAMETVRAWNLDLKACDGKRNNCAAGKSVPLSRYLKNYNAISGFQVITWFPVRTEIKEIVQKTNKILPSKIQITSLIMALGAALHLLAFGNVIKANFKKDLWAKWKSRNQHNSRCWF